MVTVTELSSIVVAVISLLGTLLNAAFQVYAQKYRDQLAQTASHNAILAKYRDPILLASRDLQARLHYLIHDNLSAYIDESNVHRDYIINYTLFLFGQYFAWIQIMRYEIQFFDFEKSAGRRQFTTLLHDITRVLSADNSHRPFRIYTGHQRAMGEVMISIDHKGQLHSIGYAEFINKMAQDDEFRRWFIHPVDDLELIARSRPGTNDKRLRELESLLLSFITLLDPNGTHLSDEGQDIRLQHHHQRPDPKRHSTDKARPRRLMKETV